MKKNKLKYADLCLHIDTNNAHDSIGEKLMNRIKDLHSKLDDLIERIKKALFMESISANGFRDLLQACKETTSPLLELIKNARATVDLSCDE